jgi:hypothetical protein
MKHIAVIILTMLFFTSFSCSTMPKSKTKEEKGKTKEITLDFSAGAPTIIYKTKEEYNNKVPITLSEDKRKIVGYPHPKDIYQNGKLAIPTKLNNGYLLDNRGVGKNTAFLNITYEEYAKLTSAPKLTEMERMILEKDPIIELCDCGNRNQFKNEIDEINSLIATNQLGKCKKIK